MSEPSYQAICEFLFHEAELLDSFSLHAWLEVLSERITYRLSCPTIRQAGERRQTYPTEVLLLEENMASLMARVKQLTSPALTVSENPHSITRRFISNVVVEHAGAGVARVRSSALIYRTRLRETEAHLFSVVRKDVIDTADGRLKLQERVARLDEAVIGARNISLLF